MATTTKTAPKKKASKAAKPSQAKTWTSRAVIRLVEPGNWAECVLCEEIVKFRARERRTQAICNVYVDSRWNRVEHYHADCYKAAGEPYGEAQGPTTTGGSR